MFFDAIRAFSAFCGEALPQGGVPAALFLMGLFGGFAHCTAMCGPFVLAQIAGNEPLMAGRRLGEWQRLRGAALLPYHLGRFTSYTALGAAAGGLGGAVTAWSGARWLLAAFLLLAALLFLAQGWSGLRRWLGRPLPGPLAVALGRLTAPLFRDPRGLRGYALGVALGFLPCGLLYGALAAAGGSGDALHGALAMAAFVLGTMPNLVLVGYVGVFFGQRARKAAEAIAVPLLLADAGFLGFLALYATRSL